MALGNTDESVPIEKIMEVIRNLKDNSIPESQNIFTLRPEGLIKKIEEETKPKRTSLFSSFKKNPN